MQFKGLSKNFLILAFTTLSCNSQLSETPLQEKNKIEDEPVLVKVTTSQAVKKTFKYSIKTSGKVQSKTQIKVEFKRAGVIENLLIANGDQVDKNSLIASLNNELDRLQMEKALITLNEKQVIFEDQMLSFRGVTDSVHLEKIKQNIGYSSGLSGYKIAFKEAELNYRNSFVYSEAKGVISGLELSKGNSVFNGQFLCFVHDQDNLTVHCTVLETDVYRIKKGTKAEIIPIANPDVLYDAVVIDVDPRVNEETGMVKIVLAITTKSKLFVGMHVQVNLAVADKESLLVPKEAIVIRSGRQVIFSVADNLAKWNYVTVGRDNGTEVEILNGLEEEAEIITSNNLQLTHDAPVQVINH